MNKQFGRLLLAGACTLVVASASYAADDSSHRLLPTDYGDLSQAQDLVARRLRHTQDWQRLQDLMKDEHLLDALKGADRDKLQQFQNEMKNNPDLLDDPRIHDLLNQAEQYKQTGESPMSRDQLTQLAKDIFDHSKPKEAPHVDSIGGAASATANPFTDTLHPPQTPPPAVRTPDSPSREFMQDMAEQLKKYKPEAESLTKTALRDLGKSNAGASSSSSGLQAFLEKTISPSQATWLTHHLTLPSLPHFDGWWPDFNSSAGPSVGGASSGGGMDTAIWFVALSLFGIAAVLALRAANRQMGGTRPESWSAGAWPVHPSRVSTREDLIRAFEHLAFLCLGPTARQLNHLDLAGRLGETAEGRTGPAERLAHLYEQARYAPPEELLCAEELAAARGDLSTMAGAVV